MNRLDMKRFGKTLLTYFVITFAWAMLYNEVIFNDALNEMAVGWRDQPIVPLGLLTIVIQAVAIHILYSRFYVGKAPIKESLTLSYLVGVFDICYASFIEPATFEVEPVWTFVAIKLIYSLVHFLLVGIAMTYVFRTNAKQRSYDTVYS